jgi:hypothetical protein
MRGFMGRAKLGLIVVGLALAITGCGGGGTTPPKDVGPDPDSDVGVDVPDTEPDIGPQCGNGTCEEGESKDTCPADCTTTDPVCGNGQCEEGEDETTCPADCKVTGPVCGNGECEEGEDATNCPDDCEIIEPVCGDGLCEEPEDETNCPDDCFEEPPVECPECPGGLCAWCELADTSCTVLDLSPCVDAADALAGAGTIPLLLGQALYPSCRQPVCGTNNKCTLEAIPHCCTTIQECSVQSGGCFFTTCQLETAPAAHMSNNPPSYCQTQILDGCCASEANTVVMDESFAVTEGLPSDWSTIDPLPNDGVGWALRTGDPLCFSGGHCLHLAWSESSAPGAAYCNTYYNGDLVDCVPSEEPGSKGASAVNVHLASKQVSLTPSDKPWVLTFQLHMNTEAPVPDVGLDGDNLVVSVNEDGNETVVFNSVSINNTTHGNWRMVAVDLSPWHGKTISLGWSFDTKDGESNFEGPVNGLFSAIVMDDVQVTTTCAEANKPCTSATADICATSDPCVASNCVFFAKKTGLSNEPESGFCFHADVLGCEACSVPDECVNPPESGGPFDAQCVGGICQYVAQNCEAEVLISEGFEGGIPAAWNKVDDGTCGNFWTATDLRASAGTQSLHFGQIAATCEGTELIVCEGLSVSDVCPSYDCGGLKADGYIESEPITLPPQSLLVLSFDLFLSTEVDTWLPMIDWLKENCTPEAPANCSDRLVLNAIYESAGDTVMETIWSSYDVGGTTQCGWEPVSVNVSGLQGKDVTFRWHFDTADSVNNDFEGLYIDHLELSKVCNEPCSSAADCSDLGQCTQATCVQGECKYETLETCCDTSLDCDDNNACTTDLCNAEHQCEYGIKDQDNCCQPDGIYWTEALDGTELPEGWIIEEGENTAVKWHWTADKGVGDSGGLYFGNIETMSYAEGSKPVSGAVILPPMDLPPGGSPTLRFDLKLDTEFSDYTAADFEAYQTINSFLPFDRLAVYASTDDGQTFSAAPIWRSEDAMPIKGATVSPDGAVEWMDMGFSLGDYVGEKGLVLKFYFDSITADENAYIGVFLDNLVLSQVCSSPINPEPCFSDAWCEDGDGCSIDSCSLGECSATPAEGKAGCCFPQPLTTYTFDSGALPGWTIDQTTDPAHWATTTLKSTSGAYSLHFGNPADGTYSGCVCASQESCSGECELNECVVPKGAATSPPFTIQSGKDYELSLSLFADLSIQEGYLGWTENFTVKLLTQTPSGVETLATVLCHAGECDVPGDICASGVNFTYPGCGDNPTEVANGNITNYGDYGHWVTKSVSLSDVLCGLNTSIAQTFVQTLQLTGTNTFWVEIFFKANDNFDNCGTGLYIDDLVLSETCSDWNGCQ